MANTAVDPANSRRRADAGWPMADHRICGTCCGVYRDIMDVDLDRAGGVRKSVDDDRSLRRAGERSLLDRMRDYGMDPRAAPISLRVAHASRVKSPVRLGPIGSRGRKFSLCEIEFRSCASNDRAIVLPNFESEFKYQPESEELGQKRGIHLHGDVAMNFERIDNRHLQTTGGIVCPTKQH